MERDPLGDILRQTDAASPPPVVADDRIITGARRKNSLRRRDRRAAVVILGLLIWMMVTDHLPRRAAPIAMSPHQATLPAASAGLSLEVQQKTVEQLLAGERDNAIFAKLSQLRRAGSPLERINQQREQVATRLLEDVAITPDRAGQESLCRQVMALFPETGAAAVARQRLAAIE